MIVIVYSKAKCGKCEAAKEKIEKLGFDYEEHSLEYHVNAHEGWREDGSTELMAYLITESETGDISVMLPTIEIEGKFYDYPAAMKKLKIIRKMIDE